MEEDIKGIALIILGIIAVISVVGLIIMLSNAQKTGQVAKSGYPDAREWYGIREARQYDLPGADATVAPRRLGELPQPAEYKARTEALYESELTAQRNLNTVSNLE